MKMVSACMILLFIINNVYCLNLNSIKIKQPKLGGFNDVDVNSVRELTSQIRSKVESKLDKTFSHFEPIEAKKSSGKPEDFFILFHRDI